MQLQYLFEAHLKDGTVISQTPQDVSLVDPEKSAYYDVMQRLSEVEVFGIYNDKATYVVDLRDGHFEINGIPFNTLSKEDSTEDDIELGPDQKFELVYFRRHVHVTMVGAELPVELSHTVDYHLGWSTKIDGKEIRRTISAR
jgi:hypothetical protein